MPHSQQSVLNRFVDVSKCSKFACILHRSMLCKVVLITSLAELEEVSLNDADISDSLQNGSPLFRPK